MIIMYNCIAYIMCIIGVKCLAKHNNDGHSRHMLKPTKRFLVYAYFEYNQVYLVYWSNPAPLQINKWLCFS